MTTPAKNVVSTTIGLMGMDSRSTRLFEMVLQQQCRNYCEVTEPDTADVIILDLDGNNVDEAREEIAEKYSDKHLVTISLRPVKTNDNAIHIRKPVDFGLLKNALGKLKAGASARRVNIDVAEHERQTLKEHAHLRAANVLGDRTDAALSGSSKNGASRFVGTDSIYFDPEEYLLGILDKAFEQSDAASSIAVISVMTKYNVIYDPEAEEVYSDIPEQVLSNIAIISTSNQTLDIETEIEKKEKLSELVLRSKYVKFTAQEFVWKLALVTSRGRVPEGTDLDRTHVMASWPNFTRLAIMPYMIRIAALWYRQPLRLKDLAEMLDLGIQDVFTFYTACYFTRHGRMARRQADNLVKAEAPRKHAMRSFFSSLVNKLSHKSNKDDLDIEATTGMV